MKGLFIYPVLLILLFGTPAFADFAKGVEAFERGDYTTAVKEWKQSAEQGQIEAQVTLGIMYEDGDIVTRDHAESAKWYKLAALQGDSNAQFFIGSMYVSGYSDAQDFKEAVKWFRLSAEQGQVEAQFALGVMYFKGKGVIQNYVHSHKWWNIAATQGDKLAAENRSMVEKRMTATQIEKAQELARECVAKDYKGC